ncbi:MAG: DMT family transporter [Alphaproteobacteria bacterium]|nr:DMT family transporter [Alphaproteobacteria bacterium]
MQNLLLYMTCVLIWGTTWYVIHFQFGLVDPLLSVSYRFFLAGLSLLAFRAVTGKYIHIPARRQLWILLQGFLLFFVSYWFSYLGVKYISSGLVAVCFSTLTIMNIVNQGIFFRLPVTKQVAAASLAGLIGITLLFWPEVKSLNLHGESVKGILFSLAAVYTASLGNIIALRNTRHGLPVFESTGFAMIYGGIFAFAAPMATGSALVFDTSFHYLWSLVYLAIFGSAIAFVAYFILIGRIGADRAAYTGVLFPVIALIISTLFEGYIWTPEAFAGLVFILGGNILALKKAK